MSVRYRRPLFWPHELSEYCQRTLNIASQWAMRALEGDRIEPGWISDAIDSGIKSGLWVDQRGLGIETRLFGRTITGEPLIEYYSDYRFRGPAWLWDVSAGDGPSSFGEIEKDILRLSTIARSEEEAVAYFEAELRKIQSSINSQWSYIADFEDEIYESIKAKLGTTKFNIV